MQEGEYHKKERPPSSLSVAGIVKCRRNRILLIQDSEGKFGLPGGGADPLEDPWDAFLREFSEETGLDGDELNRHNITLSTVVWIPGKDKNRVGVILQADYGRELPSWDGWTVDSSNRNVGFVKPFSVEEVLELVEEASLIRRSEFNLAQLTRWLLISYNEELEKKRPDKMILEKLEKWILSEMEKKSFGISKDPLNDHFLGYLPPHYISGNIITVSKSVEELGGSSIYNSWWEEALKEVLSD